MLTRLKIENFKMIENADVELGGNVVFIGPNNSGKTSALQALALWETGLKTWLAKRGKDNKELKRPGVAINRRDLIASSIPNAVLLWNDMHVRETKNKQTKNIFINITVEGVNNNDVWKCGFEFDYANPESFYCKPIRENDTGEQRMPLPQGKILDNIHVAYLPPMSGLSSIEPRLEPGRINVLLGEGQTAQVLRNICYTLSKSEETSAWREVCEHVKKLFGVDLIKPEYIQARGEVTMSYRDKSGITLDLSSSGRGFQQTLLIMAYIYANPNSLILLDEPDAHLEILRQRQIYQIISDIAKKQNSQLIIASHSEVVLNEAAEKDTVIAFTGSPHRINDKGQQVLKALKEIGYEDYYLAEERGWILYLEGTTDLSILQTFARVLNHPVKNYLDAPFVKFVCNLPSDAEKHFYALREAYSDLRGIAIYDRLGATLNSSTNFIQIQWRKREIENYFCKKEVILDYVKGKVDEEDMFSIEESKKRISVMNECIQELEKALEVTGKPGPWSGDIKVTDEFFDPLFENYFRRMELPINPLRKKSYYELAELLPSGQIDDEINEKLNEIYRIAKTIQGEK